MISVIITAYNVQDFIQDAVRSVLRQTFKDVEIVVVCDKPTDETEILVDEIAEKDSRIRVIKNERNVGAGMSRKVGIEAANGQYVMFLDGDDYYDHENFLQDLYDCAVNTGAQIVSGGGKSFTSRRFLGCNLLRKHHRRGNRQGHALLGKPYRLSRQQTY